MIHKTMLLLTVIACLFLYVTGADKLTWAVVLFTATWVYALALIIKYRT